MALPQAEQIFLREHGFIAEDCVGPDSYFAIISKISGSDARQKISELQSQPAFNLFFCAFEPEYLDRSQETLFQPDKIRQACLKRSKHYRTGPCRRDIYATTELLQRAIRMFYIKEGALEKDVFLPTFCNLISENTIEILMCLVRGEIRFYLLKRTDLPGERNWSENRNRCDCNKFHSELTESFLQVVYARESALDEMVANHWVIQKPSTMHYSFYRCLSKAMYGDEKWFHLIKNLIVKFEQQEDFLPVFQTFITKTGGNQSNNMDTQTRNHFSHPTDGLNRPGRAEFYAASSLFGTEIFIWSEYEKEWNVYHPLLPPTTTRCHFVTMAKRGDEEYELLVPARFWCNCQLKRPPVRTLKEKRSELEAIAWGLIASKPCCKDRRHGPHTHLQFLAGGAQQHFSESGIRNTGSRLSTDAEYVAELLKLKRRRLDRSHIVGGSFLQCILKEIYGAAAVVETTQFPLPGGTPNDEEIIRTVNWLRRPIYILTKDGLHAEHKWKVFLPEQVSDYRCRYYVTLYKDPETQLFERVVPIEGCNCSMPPPIEVAIDEIYKKHVGRREIKKSIRHNPRLEYFLGDITEDMITDENTYPPEDMNASVCSVLSDIYYALQRDDMANRMVDTMEGNNSLFACLSKEIFGNSSEDSIIDSLIGSEINENWKMYAAFNSGAGNSQAQTDAFASLHEFNEIHLLAAATFLQTRILILLVEPDGTSRWKEFTKLRRKPRPRQMPRLMSACLTGGTADNYCITLLRNAYGEFYRILPKDRICNCQMEQISVPGKKNGSLRDGCSIPAIGIPFIWSQNKRAAILICRTLDSVLGQVYSDVNSLYKIVAYQLDLQKKIMQIVECRHRDTERATVTGVTVSALGTAIMVAGATFAAGRGVGTLALAGFVVSFFGTGSVARSALTEEALSAKDLKTLIEIHDDLKVISESLVASVRKEINKTIFDMLRDESELLEYLGHHNFETVRTFQKIPWLCIVEEMCHAVSTLLSRMAVKTTSVMLGGVLAGFSVILDGIIIAMTAQSKTETSERLRKRRNQLQALESILKTYI